MHFWVYLLFHLLTTRCHLNGMALKCEPSHTNIICSPTHGSSSSASSIERTNSGIPMQNAKEDTQNFRKGSGQELEVQTEKQSKKNPNGRGFIQGMSSVSAPVEQAFNPSPSEHTGSCTYVKMRHYPCEIGHVLCSLGCCCLLSTCTLCSGCL
ncbi:hypothetical protein DFH28DRAFT_945156 [Melampsora americana]|nr:hypothetical protein DFH28DRAFT_945156 [Melampsora americana]